MPASPPSPSPLAERGIEFYGSVPRVAPWRAYPGLFSATPAGVLELARTWCAMRVGNSRDSRLTLSCVVVSWGLVCVRGLVRRI
jgi:hypothetical protein